LKSEVSKLASELGVTQEIIDAKPTDGLFGDARTDEDQIGASYDEIEWAMKQKDAGKKPDDTWSDTQKDAWRIYEQRNGANQHKMVEIPRCIIPKELKG
jgi:NAD+ synthase